MNRDLVLGVLSITVCGLLALAAGQLSWQGRPVAGDRSASAAEARAWRRLWLPLFPSLLAFAALIGWAAQEPAMTDELLRPVAFALAIPPTLLLLRTAVRAIGALRPLKVSPPAATVGLLRPRIIVSAALHDRLDERALAAAMAHELAHARNRDPLRIWLAQVAADLQWPSREAVKRLDDWHRALELSRDEEARRGGTQGEDLAAAIICASRLGTSVIGSATATLTTAEMDLSVRIRRLLDPLPPYRPRGRLLVAIIFVGCAIAACGLGLHFGDAIVRPLPIVAL
jgi:hypothetical protein